MTTRPIPTSSLVLPALACVAACVALLAASPARAADNPKACQLVTEAEVRAAFGAGYQVMGFTSETCAWHKSKDAVVGVVITPAPSGAAALLAERRKIFKARMDSVSGLGDNAFVVTGPRGAAFHFGKGKWIVQVEGTPAITTDLAALRSLAGAAYGRL
jgi:hypothetical protein